MKKQKIMVLKNQTQREINFRAWDIDRNVMIGDAIKLESNIIFHRAMLETAKNVVWMQFTGLKDKNVNPIYEGDIVHLCGSRFNYKVVFENGSFLLYHLVLLNGKLWGELSKMFEVKMTGYQIQIIGNIYEHPSLLK